MSCEAENGGLTNRKEKPMITYTSFYGGYGSPAKGPYDDPDYVAYCTDKERYTDDDEYDEPYREPFAVYDP